MRLRGGHFDVLVPVRYVQVEQGRRDEGKAVFYQAIHQCPWAKVLSSVPSVEHCVHVCECVCYKMFVCAVSLLTQVLYCDAVQYFPEEIEKVLEIAEEKEIRLRAPLEEAKLLWTATNQE